MSNIHATCVEVFGRGVLLIGPPGSGKSDLALRLIDASEGAVPASAGVLVADDQVIIEPRDGKLIACAPREIQGLIEIRGVGLVRLPFAGETELCLAVRLEPGRVPARLPDFSQQVMEVDGCTVPELHMDAFHASAPAKIRAMVRALLSDDLVDTVHTPGQ